MSLDDLTAAARKEFRESLDRGPQHLRWDELPPQFGDKAPDVELPDADGKTRRLSEFWADGPALVMFWRHQGCGCGVGRAENLVTEYDDYVAAGANVVIVGQAEPERAKAYAEEHKIAATILCDPTFEAYRAYGVREGQSTQTVYDAPEPFWHGDKESWDSLEKARAEGGRPLVDNPWLLPSEFVVDSDGTVRLAYHYNYCDNYPDPRVLVAAIKMANHGVGTS